MAPVTPFLLRLTRPRTRFRAPFSCTWNTLGNSEHRRKSLGVFQGTRATMLFGPDQTRGPDRIWGRRNEMRSMRGRPERVLGVALTWKSCTIIGFQSVYPLVYSEEGGGRRAGRAEESHGYAVCGGGAPQRPGKCRQRLAGKRGRDLNVSPGRSLLRLSAAIQRSHHAPRDETSGSA